MLGFLRPLGRRFAIPIAAGGLLLIGAGVSAGHRSAENNVASATIRASLDVSEEPSLARFYAARGYRPVWLRGGALGPEGVRAIEVLDRAEDHGLSRSSYVTPETSTLVREAQDGGLDPAAAGRLEAELSSAFVRYARDLRRPAPSHDLIRVAGIGPRRAVDSGRTLELVFDAGGAAGVDAALQMHPDYLRLSAALADWRSMWERLPTPRLGQGQTVMPGQRDARMPTLRVRLGVSPGRSNADLLDRDLSRRLTQFQRWHGLEETGSLDPATVDALNVDPVEYEQRLITNLDRLRALPAEPGERYVVVNAAEAALTAYDRGAPVKRMRVIVGRPETPTPMMAGLIQYVVLDPYWNIPLDLVRNDIAPAVLRNGPSSLDRRGMEALSDWSPSARRLAPADIDWPAVASGQNPLRVRQRPGPHNMMGRVKFMLPNDLGIYLHDTPLRALFDRDRRTLSAGCVRLEDARWLAQWLSGIEIARAPGQPADQRVDLRRPVPLFIIYQTASPRPGGGLVFLPDVYGRDG
jgi:murein L,D-transpeptidase YcbB/YkuD